MTEKPTSHSILKLIGQSLKHFNGFINSFQDHSGRLPVKFDKECLRSILSAKFCSSSFQNDSHKPTGTIRKPLENYQWIVTYHKANPVDVEGCFAKELKMCQEMVDCFLTN